MRPRLLSLRRQLEAARAGSSATRPSCSARFPRCPLRPRVDEAARVLLPAVGRCSRSRRHPRLPGRPRLPPHSRLLSGWLGLEVPSLLSMNAGTSESAGGSGLPRHGRARHDESALRRRAADLIMGLATQMIHGTSSFCACSRSAATGDRSTTATSATRPKLDAAAAADRADALSVRQPAIGSARCARQPPACSITSESRRRTSSAPSMGGISPAGRDRPPRRALSICSIMSTKGNCRFRSPPARVRTPDGEPPRERDGYVEQAVRSSR